MKLPSYPTDTKARNFHFNNQLQKTDFGYFIQKRDRQGQVRSNRDANFTIGSSSVKPTYETTTSAWNKHHTSPPPGHPQKSKSVVSSPMESKSKTNWRVEHPRTTNETHPDVSVTKRFHNDGTVFKGELIPLANKERITNKK